jgi:serine protease
MSAQEQIARLKLAQTSLAPLSAGVIGGPRGLARYILRSVQPADPPVLQKMAREALGDAEVFVAPLFDDSGATLFLLTLPRVHFADMGGSPYDLAYYLKDQLGLDTVEPDLETDFYRVSALEAQIEEGEEGGFIAAHCEEPKEAAPQDRAWALRMIGADTAWNEEPKPGGAKRGRGILIGQIDTGLADHRDLDDAYDFRSGLNLINPEVTPFAVDDLRDGKGENPGHGTATGSAAVSRGSVGPKPAPGASGGIVPPGNVTGVAPEAMLLPIRAIRSVVRITQSRVAQGIDLARRSRAHVITMSLGGVPSIALEEAIRRAVDENIIVMAAAGNCVGFVVWPAAYDVCAAVAAVNDKAKPWRGTSKGKAVDWCAPGCHVWVARRTSPAEGPTNTGAGQGTSFAVAMSAGAAAVWLAHHGRRQLISNLKPHERLQDLFRACVRESAGAINDPEGMGAGLLDVEKLLRIDTHAVNVEVRRFGSGTALAEAEKIRALAGDEGAAARIDPELAHEVTWLAMNRARAEHDGAEEGAVLTAPPRSERLRAQLSV